MLDKVRIVIGEEDVANPKPDPEGILKAMKILNSKKALYVGDGVGDIEAGKMPKLIRLESYIPIVRIKFLLLSLPTQFVIYQKF